jgi:N-acetylglucosamine-1-phosphodiester alpha-N-acetylglucosaminidase
VRAEALRIPSVGGGYMLIASDPVATVSVYEPGKVGGCTDALPPTSTNGRTVVSNSAGHYGCELAVNAGFFNTTDGECHGNIVSNGRVVQDDGPSNVNFGVLHNGSIVVGYLNETSIREWDPPFVQLVAGVIWLVRDGENYVDRSIEIEYGGTQEGTNLRRFADIISARVGLGHDADGNVRVLQINGKSWARGMRLTEFADLLIEHGFVNAINLDGGGSATTVVNGTPVSELSDSCPVEACTDCPANLPHAGFSNCADWCAQYKCERPVSTIICMHRPICYDCEPESECTERECTTSTTTTATTTTMSTTWTAPDETELIAAHSEVNHWKVGFAIALTLLQLLVVVNGIYFCRKTRCAKGRTRWMLSPDYKHGGAEEPEQGASRAPLIGIGAYDFSSDEGENDWVSIDETGL